MSAPRALDDAARSSGTRAALLEGAVAAVASAGALAAAAAGAARLAPRAAAAVPAAPFRVFAACVVTGAFAYASGLSQAHHSIRTNVNFARALEERDAAARRARGA